ncbi:CYFA0S12e02960g1_1 [Cyberlindnera fabianii]|uniref:CYFA0S12e02960g1_1 n=1 Tax=Cyberlindnera fabianii TaxID=36022 RepID=A0A061B2H5_CYBFA|nr:hypothetical protein BON22_4767 [Cyberlindnera fabianii]CDR43661.1 CYFA0S12e02960g1_1 [Cyberlindnera fabianii]
MSSVLFRQPAFKRVPLVRYSARTKRENRISVQLLKDFPQFGQKGEIIEVLPGLMRNRLHPNNGATYIDPKLGLGPKIPVVKRDVRQQQVQTQRQQSLKQQTAQVAAQKALEKEADTTKKTPQKINPVELKGLLFDIPSEASGSSGNITPSSGYSMLTLNITLGTLQFSLSETNPITKATVSDKITQAVGLTTPVSDIKLTNAKKEEIEEISTEGTYKLTISQEGSQSVVTKTIQVSA